MSEPGRLGASLGRLPTIARTIRPLRLDQAVAQIRHAVWGLPAPVQLPDPPPRLAVTAASTPYLDPPAHVRANDPRQIELLATPFDLGLETDWSTTRHGPLFAYHLHQHEYLRRAAFTPNDRSRRMLDWIARHRSGIGWDPHPISLRLLCWGKLLTTPGAVELSAAQRDAILGSLADQAETLRRGVEVRLQANHLLSNRIGVVFAGILLDGALSGSWLAESDALADEIDSQIHPDGGHEERSPMYHALLLESVLDLLNLAAAAPDRAPEGLIPVVRAAAERMLVALDLWTHVDGGIALFADSAFGMASTPAEIADYAARLGLPAGRRREHSGLLPQTGYLRLRADDVDLLASVAGPSPPHQPGHAHCDALAFELCLGGARLVTDTGVCEYVPGARRSRARSTAAHATIQIDDEEQAEIWAAHRVGGRPEVELIGWDGERRAEASCRGWSRPEILHRRTFRLEPEGLVVIDRVEGPECRVRGVLPLDPAWSVELGADGEDVHAIATRIAPAGSEAIVPGAPRVRVAEPIQVQIGLDRSLTWRIESGPYYPAFGLELERAILVGEGRGPLEAETRFARPTPRAPRRPPTA